MDIGGEIRKARENRGLTQAELAEKLGISSKTVSSWEVGRTEPKMGMVERVCAVLNCRKSDLIDEVHYENRALLSLAEDAILIETIRTLDSDRKKRLMEYARYLLYQQNEGPQDK